MPLVISSNIHMVTFISLGSTSAVSPQDWSTTAGSVGSLGDQHGPAGGPTTVAGCWRLTIFPTVNLPENKWPMMMLPSQYLWDHPRILW